MDTSNMFQIIVSSPAFAELAENWFGITKNKIIKVVLFVERAIYFNAAIILTLVLSQITNPESSHAGIVKISLFTSSIVGILIVIFGSIVFDRFVSKFNQLLKILSIDLEVDEHLRQLYDFGFLESRSKQYTDEWLAQYLEVLKFNGHFSKETRNAGKDFCRRYELLRKFGLADKEVETFMRNRLRKPNPA